VSVTVNEYTVVTFHYECVRTVQHVIGPRLKSLTRDQHFSASCDQRLSRGRQVLLAKQYFTHVVGVTAIITCVIKHPTTHPSHPHRRTRRVWKGCMHVQAGDGAGWALVGEYVNTRCTTTTIIVYYPSIYYFQLALICQRSSTHNPAVASTCAPHWVEDTEKVL
jgi:hypothetical protein